MANLFKKGVGGVPGHQVSITDEIQVMDGPMSEDQVNRGRIGLLKVAKGYPVGSGSRKLLIEQVTKSYN